MTNQEAIEVLKDWDGYFIGHSMKLTEIHNEILLYIAYKEGLMSKTDYINYLKSQMMEIANMNTEREK